MTEEDYMANWSAEDEAVYQELLQLSHEAARTRIDVDEVVFVGNEHGIFPEVKGHLQDGTEVSMPLGELVFAMAQAHQSGVFAGLSERSLNELRMLFPRLPKSMTRGDAR